MINNDPTFFLRRENLIKEFFKIFKIDVTLIGNDNSPLIVNNNNIAYCCFVHNFTLCFTDKSHDAKILFKVKLNKFGNYDLSENLFYEWLNKSIHRKIYFLKSGNFYFHSSKSNNLKSAALWVKEKNLGHFVFSIERANFLKKEIDLDSNDVIIE